MSSYILLILFYAHNSYHLHQSPLCNNQVCYDVLKHNAPQELKAANLSCENAHDSFLEHMQIVNTYIAYTLR